MPVWLQSSLAKQILRRGSFAVEWLCSVLWRKEARDHKKVPRPGYQKLNTTLGTGGPGSELEARSEAVWEIRGTKESYGRKLLTEASLPLKAWGFLS